MKSSMHSPLTQSTVLQMEMGGVGVGVMKMDVAELAVLESDIVVSTVDIVTVDIVGVRNDVVSPGEENEVVKPGGSDVSVGKNVSIDVSGKMTVSELKDDDGVGVRDVNGLDRSELEVTTGEDKMVVVGTGDSAVEKGIRNDVVVEGLKSEVDGMKTVVSGGKNVGSKEVKIGDADISTVDLEIVTPKELGCDVMGRENEEIKVVGIGRDEDKGTEDDKLGGSLK